jgi:hypothetical protein
MAVRLSALNASSHISARRFLVLVSERGLGRSAGGASGATELSNEAAGDKMFSSLLLFLVIYMDRTTAIITVHL